MGFPFMGGWAEQPFWISEIIHMFEGVYNEEQSSKFNKGNKSSSLSKSSTTKPKNITTFNQ